VPTRRELVRAALMVMFGADPARVVVADVFVNPRLIKEIRGSF
jgi:hypothetical protein